MLVAFETLHYLKRKTQGKVDQMALKLDMSKAYDKVEWEFLERIMRHLGLGDRLVNLIMSCISSVLILCSLMVSLWDLLNRNEVFVRVILYHPISFSCVQWASKACFIQ